MWAKGLALSEEQAEQIPEVKTLVDDPLEWLRFWSTQIGAELRDGLRRDLSSRSGTRTQRPWQALDVPPHAQPLAISSNARS